MRIVHLVLILMCGPMQTACAASVKRDYTFIAIPDKLNDDENKKLTASEVAYDLEQLKYALENAYSGRKFLPDRQFPEMLDRLSQIHGPLPVKEFCQKIGAEMNRVVDYHLAAKFKGDRCFKDDSKRTAQVGPNYYKPTDEKPWDVRIQKRRKSKALLISITGFPSSASPVWNGFIDSVKSNLAKADLVILDMRGNRGGDDTKGYELSYLLAGTKLKSPYLPQWTSQTPESYQLYVNTFESWIRQDLADHKSPSQYIVDLKAHYTQMRDNVLAGKPPEDQPQDDGSEFDYAKSIQKPIYILIDAACVSSCESTTDAFEFNKLVKTIGERTGGYVHFGNNASVFLKNSGINAQMAISYNRYYDGRFIEKIGMEPKIKVPPGRNALDYAWDDFFRGKKP